MSPGREPLFFDDLEAALIRWIQKYAWLSSSILSALSLLLFGAIDLLVQGYQGLIVAAIFSVALLFSFQIPAASVSLIVVGTVVEIWLGLSPVAGGLSATVALFFAAIFAIRLWYFISFAVAVLSGVAIAWFNSFELLPGGDLYGLSLPDEKSQFTVFLISSLLVVTVNFLAWFLGRLAITYKTYATIEFDRGLAAETQVRLSLEIAEQKERFEIARDINELIIQKITAVISQAEGGAYAARVDQSSALRSLERVSVSARAAHMELRRLFDMFSKSRSVSATPPSIDELDNLAIAYRERGYNVSISHEGTRFKINEGADLAIYRIIFAALENVKKHCIVGTDVSIDFSWVEEGMQVLIKDNGLEVMRRSQASGELEDSGYGMEEDASSLVEVITGAGVTAMRERAALYAGRIEATKVPGVGFTVSAIFPHLHSLAGEE